MTKKKKEGKAGAETSVKSYKQGVEAEKQKMSNYSKKFGTNVRSLQSKFKGYRKDLKEAASKMREDGVKKMAAKINKFKGKIRDQIKENKESVSHMENNVKYFVSQINKKKKDFESYARGPFHEYIKAFWG